MLVHLFAVAGWPFSLSVGTGQVVNPRKEEHNFFQIFSHIPVD